MTVALERPALEVAEVLRQYGDAFLNRYGSVLSTTQRRVKQVGLSKHCSMHTLRHSYATHLSTVR